MVVGFIRRFGGAWIVLYRKYVMRVCFYIHFYVAFRFLWMGMLAGRQIWAFAGHIPVCCSLVVRL